MLSAPLLSKYFFTNHLYVTMPISKVLKNVNKGTTEEEESNENNEDEEDLFFLCKRKHRTSVLS